MKNAKQVDAYPCPENAILHSFTFKEKAGMNENVAKNRSDDYANHQLTADHKRLWYIESQMPEIAI